MSELLGFNRIRFTFRDETVTHFLLPGFSITTWCEKQGGPNPEPVDDEPVTCPECMQRVRGVFRWWWPRKPFPAWMCRLAAGEVDDV